MLCNILGCNTESNFKLLYCHYNNSKKPFAKGIMRVCENHAILISNDDSALMVTVLS
ncbi:MAG: hypothetical protein MAG458_01229 [Nitrosopumilus sp.]|nr:hypothetical protein [Nitrosopumilus sp.]